MDLESQRDLRMLEAIAGNERTTQRTLASRLGIAVGLTNVSLKRLARQGFVEFVSVPPNRMVYRLTPKGVGEKSRLTYEFMRYSLHLYGQVRQHLRRTLEPCVRDNKRVAIYGAGEVAEAAYLALKEFGVEPVAVYDGRHGGLFLGVPVACVSDADHAAYDVLVVASLESETSAIDALIRAGIPREKLLPLRPSRSDRWAQ